MVWDIKQLYFTAFILGIIGGLGYFLKSDALMVIAILGCIIIAVYIWHQDLKDEKRVSKRFSETHLFTCLLIVSIIAAIGAFPAFYLLSLSAGFIGGLSNAPIPIETTYTTIPTIPPTIQNVITTTIIPTPTPRTSDVSCDILGKWRQTRYENTPVTGVYIQIKPGRQIEIYLNNQLRSWGPYDLIAPNQIRHTWSGGVDAGTGDIITISSDCQTLDVVSFRGEHSTFVRES